MARTDEAIASGRKFLETSKLDEDEDEDVEVTDEEVQVTGTGKRRIAGMERTSANFNAGQDRDSLQAKLARVKKEREEWKKFDLQGRLKASDELLAGADEVLARGKAFIEKKELRKEKGEKEDVKITPETSAKGIG